MDWQAIGAVATGVAAVVTAAMAIYTRSMAKATKELAETARQQVGLLDRQTAAAETSVEQAQRTMNVRETPILRVERIVGDQAMIAADSDGFGVTLRNRGPVTANVTQARITETGTLLLPVSGNPAPPEETMYLYGDVDPAVMQKLEAGRIHPEIAVTYESPGGVPSYTRFRLQSKDNGERWLITQQEQDTAKESKAYFGS